MNETEETDLGKVLLYARVSTNMQVNEGVSLDVQERQMVTAAEFHGFKDWELVREEGRSGKSISGRPALQQALKNLNEGKAQALIVTRIDRLARSTTDFLKIVDMANQKNWRLILLDLNLDTSSYQGRFVVTIMSALAEMERGIIAERAKDIHKDRRNRGIVWGKDMGPKNKTPEEIKKRILEERLKGHSLRKIAENLNRDNIPTQNGKQWHAMTVKNILDGIEELDK